MQKIDSKELLLEVGLAAGTDRLTFMRDYGADGPLEMLKSPSFNGRVRSLVLPSNRRVVADHQDFNDLPDEFFVDIELQVANLPRPASDKDITDMANSCINDENYWVFREAYRLQTSVYTAPVFIKPLMQRNKLHDNLVLHFPHTSVEDPTMVAFTPSHEYGKRDRQVRMKVGKYLTKYYSGVLTPEEIRAFANGSKGLEVKFAETEAEMRYVYRHGPSSCMSGHVDEFHDIEGDYHPVDVYADGDFRLAYIEPMEKSILARAFVNERHKIWVRAYGDEANTLGDWLCENGYEHLDTWENCYLKIVKDDNNQFVLPFLDGNTKGVRQKDGKWLITSHNTDIRCDFTNGVYSDSDNGTCDCCGSDVPEDSLTWSEYHQESICEGCIDRYCFAYYSGGRTFVHQDECVYNESNDEHYEYHYAIEEAGLVQTTDGCWYHYDDTVEDLDGEHIYTGDALEVGEEDGSPVYASRGEYNSDFVIQFDGATPLRVWHTNYLPRDIDLAFQCDEFITADNGCQMGKCFRTINELLLVYGVDMALRTLHKVNMRISRYQLETRLMYLNKIEKIAA
jgi:hypothetical protein